MKIVPTPFDGLMEIHPAVYEDNRGYFFEAFKQKVLEDHGIHENWVQENQSFSMKGTVRGLHYQREPFAQAKLVRVLQGSVLDVVLDLRKDSKTFGKTYTKILDGVQHHLLYVPAGFAHGFSVLEDALFTYRCSSYYHKESEGGILWNDPELGIDWQVEQAILSEKDKILPTLAAFVEKEGGL